MKDREKILFTDYAIYVTLFIVTGCRPHDNFFGVCGAFIMEKGGQCEYISYKKY